jgi:hypothetical protein
MSAEVPLEPYRDDVDAFALLVPAGWERVEPPVDEVRLVVVEPLAEQGFRANCVVTVDTLPAGLDLGQWQDGNDAMMPAMLDDWQLLDRVTERRDSGARGSQHVVHRLGHHSAAGGAPVSMRQVALIDQGRALTLTTSIWTPSYPSLLSAVLRIERSFPTGARADETASE